MKRLDAIKSILNAQDDFEWLVKIRKLEKENKRLVRENEDLKHQLDNIVFNLLGISEDTEHKYQKMTEEDQERFKVLDEIQYNIKLVLRFVSPRYHHVPPQLLSK